MNQKQIEFKRPQDEENWIEVFTPYITKNGRRVYPKRAKVFHFWIPKVSKN